jgi:predicted dehydrogenase
MNERLRVGLVGCGAISGGHLDAYRHLADQFEVLAICDVVEEKARRRADEFGVPRVVTDVQALYAMPDLDIIDITTPPYLHTPMAIGAMEAGKLAFSEKPVAGSLGDIDRLAEAEQRTGRRVMPIFNYRFGAGLQRLKHLMALGITGKLFLSTVETHWQRPAGYFSVRWRASWRAALGGAFIGHAIHAHDALYEIAGPARSVFARGKALVNPTEIEDTLAVSLEMANGSLAALSVTFGSAVEISRHRYCFANLVAESNPAGPYATHTSDPWTFKGVSPEIDEQISKAMAEFTPEPPEGFVGQFQRLHTALASGRELPITLADGRRAIDLVTGVYYSMHTGLAVELPIQPGHPYYNGCIPPESAALEEFTDYAGHREKSGWKPSNV